jgi:sugar lactone lactonase YvrE
MPAFLIVVLLLFLPAYLHAVTPQFWEENSQDALADGDPQSVSITSDGELLLAPQLKKIYDGSQSIIWKIVRDSKGNVYAATGNEGKVLKIDAQGKVTTFLDTNELEVQSILVDKEDNLYAATSPDGKIYRIKPDGTSKVFFDPADRYIWSLAMDDDGNLYAGTGDQGKIYKIDKTGAGKLWLDTNETNITVVVWDKAKKLLAGSDKNGVLYTVDNSGKAFVLFDTDLQQITSIYCDPGGDIYFSAISGAIPATNQKVLPEQTQPAIQVQPGAKEPGQQQQAGGDQEHPPSGGEGEEGEAEVTTSVEIAGVNPQPATQSKPTGASQVYRMTANGLIEEVYTATEDQILDISGYKEGMILLATGKKAKLILLDKNKKSTILLKAPEEQITSVVQSEKTLVATANPGNIYELAEDHSAKGTYYSDIKDTQTLSQWGHLSWKANLPKGTTLSLSVRSGNTKNPDETWSAWQSAGTDPAGKTMGIPKARFVQWKADFATTDAKITPVLRDIRLAYLQQNLRPEVLSITVYPLGTVYRKAYSADSFAGVLDSDSGTEEQQDQATAAAQAQTDVSQTLGKKEYRHGYQTITWTTADENQDELRYDVYYRPEGEKIWRLLAKDLRDRIFAWDTQTMPDGTYTTKIIVNDSGSNPRELTLSNEKESDSFDIDNSPPRIDVISATRNKGVINVEVKAQDEYSAIKEMRYSVQPGVWNTIFPIDSINDSPNETYRIEIKNAADDSPDIILKCSDRENNVATIKYALPK